MSTAPKFSIGQRVTARVGGYTWTGTITKRANVRDDADGPEWEYEVSDGPTKGSGEFPLFAWEEELTLEEP